MSEVLIEVRNVGKKFCKDFKRSLVYGVQDIGRELIGKGSTVKLRKSEFWALRNISFELKRGECLGLIGHNGAGKSTLLKILNGLIKPDEGEIILKGKVAALIELGAGFNPILTGRENIYNNASVLGFTKKEIDEKIDEIIEFAEIGDFVDSPVQNYSSGMKVRLGFAVAAQMQPDVLFVDEVLAVGDLGFVLKCLNSIDNLLKSTCVIFVSHAMPMVSRVCTDILLMENGRIEYFGKDKSHGISLYVSKFNPTGEANVIFQEDSRNQLTKAKILSETVSVGGIEQVNRLSTLNLNFEFETSSDEEDVTVGVTFYDNEERPVAICQSDVFKQKLVLEDEKVKRYNVKVELERIQFSAGNYKVTFFLLSNGTPLLRVSNVLVFQVKSENVVFPFFELEGNWS